MSQHPYVAAATTANERFKRQDQLRYAAMRFRVWHIPQVPGKSFEIQCNTLATAIGLMNVLADYDLFQLHNRIKPDYANASGVQYYDHDAKEWFEFEVRDELDDYRGAMISVAGMGLDVPELPVPGWVLGPEETMKVVES